ncbi:MAG: hypothetical protein IJ226_02740 [Clostridia bacterium]|nr:hypothetical protein [Clostridia bacterium]
MRELDYVEVTVEKEKYAKEGVHKGMRGTILDPRNIDGCWLVYFSDPVTHADTIGIPINEIDLKVVEPHVDPTLVQLIVEKETYLQQGLYKGLYGEIWEQLTDKAIIGFENRIATQIDNEDFVIIDENNVDYKKIREKMNNLHFS